MRSITESRSVDIRAPGGFHAVVKVAHERLTLEGPHKSFGNAQAHDHGAERVNQAAECSESNGNCVSKVSGAQPR